MMMTGLIQMLPQGRCQLPEPKRVDCHHGFRVLPDDQTQPQTAVQSIQPLPGLDDEWFVMFCSLEVLPSVAFLYHSACSQSVISVGSVHHAMKCMLCFILLRQNAKPV